MADAHNQEGEEEIDDEYEEDEDDFSFDDDDDDEEEEEEELIEESTDDDDDDDAEPLHPLSASAHKMGKDLPKLVKEELDKRKRGQAKGPPNPLVVHALRQYFESGKGDPMICGGFMTLMREIGAVAQSKDHLVKHSEHNIWYLGAKGEEDTNEWWQDQLERHEAEVRLLRYGEFMEMQEIKGLSFESNNYGSQSSPSNQQQQWKFNPLDDKEDLVGEDTLKCNPITLEEETGEEGTATTTVKQQSMEEDLDQKPAAKVNPTASSSTTATTANSGGNQNQVDDTTIGKKQQEGLSKNFIAAFVRYVDLVEEAQQQQQQKTAAAATAAPAGVTKVNGRQPVKGNNNNAKRPAQEDPHHNNQQQQSNNTTNRIPITEEFIRTKCQQLQKNYKELNRPLGNNYVMDTEPSSSAKKLSGKKNRRRQRQNKAKIGGAGGAGGGGNVVGGSGAGGKRKDHGDCIKEHIHTLIALWDQQLLVRRPATFPSSATCARMVSSMIEMLTVAAKVDPDVCRGLATASINHNGNNHHNSSHNHHHHNKNTNNHKQHETVALVELRERTLTFALEVDAADTATRPLWAANAWWRLYADLTMFLADIIVTLTGDKENRNEYRTTAATPLTPDEKLASKLFETSVSPSLLKSIESPHAAERCAALKAMGRIVCGISVELAMGLVKPKKTWDLLEQACMGTASSIIVGAANANNKSRGKVDAKIANGTATATEDGTTATINKRAKRREEIMAPRSSAQATALMIRLCGTGMIKEDSDGPPGMTIIPGPLARKMIQRGIVPFLMNLSRSDNALISAEAVGGLAQVSCVKDCRTSLLQQPDVVAWLESIFLSPEGNKVSQGILLARHLLWDDDWLQPILSIQPPIEQTIVKWAAYCMKCIRERADDVREISKKLADEFMARSLSKIKLSESEDPSANDDPTFESDIQEMEARMKSQLPWNKLETDEGRTHVTNLALSRSVIFLSTLIRDKVTSERVLKANCLALGAACLDVPVDDTNSAAANIIGNYLATAGSVSPNVFPDPDHVVRAAISRLSRLVNRQDITPRSFIFVRLLNGLRKNTDWAPFFQSCADQDMEHKYVIEVFLPKIGDNIPSSNPPPKTPRRGGPGVGVGSDDNHNNNHGSNHHHYPNHKGVGGGGVKKNGSGRPHGNSRVRPKPTSRAAPKLNMCDACGKTESHPGEFKKCSQCNVTYYCGRTCQTNAWKKHKKICPTLAAPKKIGKRALKKKT